MNFSRRGSSTSFASTHQDPVGIVRSAWHLLPQPLLLLSSKKFILAANHAIVELLGDNLALDPLHEPQLKSRGWEGEPVEKLGIRVRMRDANQWTSLDAFLDSCRGFGEHSSLSTGQVKRTKTSRAAAIDLERDSTYDFYADALLPSLDDVVLEASRYGKTGLTRARHVSAKMTVTRWTQDTVQYFNIVFQLPDMPKKAENTSKSHVPHTCDVVPRPIAVPPTGHGIYGTPKDVLPKADPRLPNNVLNDSIQDPNRRCGAQNFSHFQRSTVVKNAIMESTQLPIYAMWRDEEFGLASAAFLSLFNADERPKSTTGKQRSILGKLHLWTDDFSRELDVDELPMFRICSGGKAIQGRRYGKKNDGNGANQVFEVVGEPFWDDSGTELLGSLVMLKDITAYAQQIASQEQQNEEQFETIANMIPQPVWTAKADGRVDWYSRRWREYTGVTNDTAFGHDWDVVFHPEDMPKTMERWKYSLATGMEYTTEYRCRRYDGVWMWMLGRASPLRDRDGRIVKWFGTCTDIDDLIKTQRDASEMREQLERVIECSQVGLWIVNSDRRIVVHQGYLPANLNDGISLIGEDIYRASESRVEGDFLRAMRENVDKVFSKSALESAVDLRDRVSQRWFSIKIMPVLAGGLEGPDSDKPVERVILVSMDVTGIRKRDQELRAKEEDRRASLARATSAKEASEMKSRFLAMASHEFRTPLVGIIGITEQLLDMNLNARQNEFLGMVRSAAENLLLVVNDILDLSRVEAGKLQVEKIAFCLGDVVADVNLMIRQSSKSRGVIYEYVAENAALQSLNLIGDPARLRQILINLLSNSVKFTKKGKVGLNIYKSAVTEELLSLSFVCWDTGIGIDSEAQKRLFQPFSQAKDSTAREFGGTGLGLAIVKNLTELMGGTVRLESEAGQGCRVTVSLPFTKPVVQVRGNEPRRASKPHKTSNGPEDHPDEHSVTIADVGNLLSQTDAVGNPVLSDVQRAEVDILVVDDNDVNRHIAMRTISKQGFSVSCVEDGREALDYLLKCARLDTKPPDIILMDIQMPRLNGYEATRIVRTGSLFQDSLWAQEIPIIAMTASGLPGEEAKCRNAGMDDFILKPLRPKHLEEMLLKWIAARGEYADD